MAEGSFGRGGFPWLKPHAADLTPLLIPPAGVLCEGVAVAFFGEFSKPGDSFCSFLRPRRGSGEVLDGLGGVRGGTLAP